jgi:hypothetical protein
VKGVWASIDQFLNKLGDLGSGSPFLGKTLDLVGSWDLSSEEQPEQSFWQWLRSTWGGGELGLTFRDGLSSESDTLVGIQNRSFPD